MEAVAAGPVAIAISVSGGFRGAHRFSQIINELTTYNRTQFSVTSLRLSADLVDIAECACAGYKSGVLKAPGCTDFKIDHSVSLVGYDTSPAAQALSNSTGYW
jgi:hypothetical protein